MKELGLYIHIPFCERKCHYCAFSSVPHPGENTVDAYFEALLKEIEGWKGNQSKVRTVYFGGGTPSYVPAEKILLVMKKLEEVFHFDALDPEMEKTIEVNPGSANIEKLQQYFQMGFNRLSVGLQAAQNALLEITGRIHQVSDFVSTIKNAEEIGFTNISADLLFGLPGQTLEDIDESIILLSSFKQIRHVSCYSLSIEDGTIFDHWQKSGKLELPDDGLERKMYHYIYQQLKAIGFDQYEISNFAQKGFESRHNGSYWNLTPYIGLGASAASYYNNSRWQNVSDLQVYSEKIFNQKSVREEEHVLSEKERRGDYMFLGLRRTRGVSNRDYQNIFGNSFFDDYGEEIQVLIEQELIHREKDRIFLTSKGMDLANQVFMAFV